MNIKEFGGASVSLGQTTMSASIPVTLASNQTDINIGNITGTISLPTGAATSAKQDTGNTSLSNIDTKIPSNLTVTSTRLLVDGSGVTQPISAASLPLPSGASTSSNQTDGSQKTQIVDGLGTVIGSTSNALDSYITNSSIAVTGTFWQATQPVSGTVTANAGTNLNTSALALESGGNLATIAGAVSASKMNINISSGSIANTSFEATQATATNLKAEVVGTGTFATQLTANPLVSSPLVGQAIIAVSGTAVRLNGGTSQALTNGIIISAPSGNVAPISIGDSSVNNTQDGTGNGYLLAPGASISFAVNNTNVVYINGTAGDYISWAGS